VLARLFSEARARFETLLRKSLLFGMTSTLLVAILLATAAEPLMGFLYKGEEYATSALLLRIVVPFVIAFMWNALLSKGLMVSNLQRRSVIVSSAKLGAGLVYYPLLTTWLGATGTAIATVLAGFTGTVLNYYFVNREICSLDLIALAAKPLAIGAVLLAVLWVARGLAWPGLIVGGTILYVSLLVLLRVFSKDDIRLFWQMVRPL
jgi:O-antigen/teichoic acid export membrane protein